ncbi:urate hydroxylase PuuD [Labrys wisconsinensis]|uniref:Membrane protein n=1 Tax=Labrys wisconsinensis TaxID=425677 RepID=A0ABU0J7M6_9HYPH|nr:urate hydroxylase PuuD [Labrys wisconsinensis]MDQ0469274.1 putative membrane protein [Labrys wisconsinensis]
MSAFLVDWLNLLLRWAHIVLAIGWIGASFYFVWLDFSLRRRERMNEGVYGTSWMVHGGGFYHVEKYTVAPAALPPDLHWFQWEAYLTFVTGMLLMAVQYYWNADAYLIDASVMPLSRGGAILISLASLAGGWLIYDGLCRSPVGRHTGLLVLCVFVLVVGAAFLFTHIFSGRGALIHVGAFVGTIMAANVFRIIIPNQRILVGQLLRGEKPDADLGRIGKQRSLHNNYLTLPVIVMMVSNHYPLLTDHPHAWLVVALILVAGAMIRHLINRADAGDPFEGYAWTLPVIALALFVAMFVTAPREAEAVVTGPVSDERAMTIAATHCIACHSEKPTNPTFTKAPKGVHLDTIDNLRKYAAQIEQQAVKGRAMPLGNTTHITDLERAELGAWIAAQK